MLDEYNKKKAQVQQNFKESVELKKQIYEINIEVT